MDASGVPEDDKTQWVAPQSWAVENPGDDSMLADYSNFNILQQPALKSRIDFVYFMISLVCDCSQSPKSQIDFVLFTISLIHDCYRFFLFFKINFVF